MLSTDYEDIGKINFCNNEVLPLFGYTSTFLIGKDINIIMPSEIGKVHRKLMLRFFDNTNSSVLNKMRELYAIDKDGFLLPVILLTKLLPSLRNGLKLIGMINKAKTFSEVP